MSDHWVIRNVVFLVAPLIWYLARVGLHSWQHTCAWYCRWLFCGRCSGSFCRICSYKTFHNGSKGSRQPQIRHSAEQLCRRAWEG